MTITGRVDLVRSDNRVCNDETNKCSDDDHPLKTQDYSFMISTYVTGMSIFTRFNIFMRKFRWRFDKTSAISARRRLVYSESGRPG